MKHILKVFSLGLVVILAVACSKDTQEHGCTDHLAANYNPTAITEDGSCLYNQDTQMIWSDGVRGGWNGDLHEGAYRLEVCAGEKSILEEIRDSSTVDKTLYLGTGGGTEHHSYFTLINEHDARDFAEGSLRMDVRVSDTDDGAPEFFNLFISGKIHEEAECDPFRRSEYVEISTHSFNDSTFTSVVVPIRHFNKIMMERVEVVCGIAFEGERSTGVELNNVRWVANPY